MTPAAVVVPEYGERSIADLLPAVLAALGVHGERDVFGLAPAPRVCVLLVDGLGWSLLSRHSRTAPFLWSLAADQRPATSGFPSTTAASIASLGTGLPPGQHGVLGYEVEAPGGGVLNALQWDTARVDPLTYQPAPTVFDRGAAAGVPVAVVGPPAFAGSGLTLAALRGATYVAAASPAERAAAAIELMRRDGGLAYVYYGDLDAAGHRHGCTSTAWELELGRVDRFAADLAERLPRGTTLVVTADHGMVDVGADSRVDLAAEPALRSGVRLATGEPRAVYLHAVPGAVADVRAAWADRLGDRMHVRLTDEVIEAGWFGPVRPDARARVGDVVVVAGVDDVAVVDSASMPPALLSLVGMHGALTPDEVLVPVLAAEL